MKNTKEHLGQKIKRLRAYRGLTQENLAEALGKTRSLVSFLERTGNINKYTLQEIAKVLGVTADQLNDKSDHSSISEQIFSNSSSKTGNIVEQLKKENEFLKETIQHQMESDKSSFRKN